MVYLAQTILSSMQVFILALPPRIAAVWFPPKEVRLFIIIYHNPVL